MLHVVKNPEDDFEDVIPPMRQECITISLQYFKHHSQASEHAFNMHSRNLHFLFISKHQLLPCIIHKANTTLLPLFYI